MPRQLRSAQLETRNSRSKLPKQSKPHWFTVAPGISLGYRAGPGSWNVRAADGVGSNWIKSFGIADDHEDADGIDILDFWQACDKAKQLARGKGTDSGKPATVAEALDDYGGDLAVRNAGATNASVPRRHLTPALLARPVGLLTVRDLRSWRNALAKDMKASTINRINRALKAALNLAASQDARIISRAAWTTGLASLPEADISASNLVLSDEQCRAVVAAAYEIGMEFGIYTEVHAVSGARSSQIALLDVDDLHAGAKPLLMVPSSLKGRGRTARTRKPTPISPSLAQRLKRLAAGRPAGEPLLTMPNGSRWNAMAHQRLFAAAARASALPVGATIYCLRHSAITKALLAGVPTRLVAASFDTSVQMLERTYSKNIASHGDDLMRRVVLDADTRAAGNVVPLAR